MNAQAWAAAIAAAGVICSLVGAGFVVSWRAGKVLAELRAADAANRATQASELRTISDRLTRIEGMFELRLRD